jgi:transcriptional regulator with XRE-family HTH domain
METAMLTGPLCAAARALVEISQSRLAEKVGIHESVILDFENGSSEPDHATIELLESKLEELGAVFLPDGKTMGAGVRLKFNKSITRRLATLENEGGPSRNDDVQ